MMSRYDKCFVYNNNEFGASRALNVRMRTTTDVFGAVFRVAVLSGLILNMHVQDGEAGPLLNLPTHGDVVHFDLTGGFGSVLLDPAPNVPGVPVANVGGPCSAGPGTVACSFEDSLSSAALLSWETEIHNPNPFAMLFTVGFLSPATDPIIGTLGLGAGQSFLVNVRVDDSPLETTMWNWFALNNIAGGAVRIDTGVSEDFVADGALGGDFIALLTDPTNDFFTLDPRIVAPDIVINAIVASPVPEPSTLVLFIGGWIAASATRRRRRLVGSRRNLFGS